jgi:hypothetical protein
MIVILSIECSQSKTNVEFQEDSAKFPTQQKSDPYSRPDGPVKRPDALLCREDSENSAYIRPDSRVSLSGRSSLFEKSPNFLCRHGLER